MRTMRYLGQAARAGILVLAWQGISQAKVELGIVASTETAVAGTDDGHIFAFSKVYLAKNGNLAWIANVKGTGLVAEMGLWRDVGKGAELVLLDGDAIDGFDGGVNIADDPAFATVPGPYIDEDGNVTVRVGIPGISAAIVTGMTGDWQIVAEQSTAAPGVDELTFYELHAFYTAAAGTILFEGTVANAQGQNKQYGIWLWKNGKTKLVALTGDPAPGYDGQFFDSAVAPKITALNTDGRFVFYASRTGDSAVNRGALWTGTSADDLEVAIALDPPKEVDRIGLGLVTGGRYIHQVTLDDTIFVAGAASSNQSALWAIADGEPKLVAGTGRPAPGVPAGDTFDAIPIWPPDVLDSRSQPSFSPQGRVAFAASTQSNSKDAYGVWSGDASGTRLVCSSLAHYEGLDDITPYGYKFVATNDLGQLAIDTTSTFSGSTTDRHVLLRYTPSEGFEKVLMPDDAVTDENDKKRVVTDYRIPCDDPYSAAMGTSCQDAKGRIAVVATFADGTEALVLSNEQAPGEPEEPQAPATAGTGGTGGTSTSGSSAGAPDDVGGSSAASGSGGSTSKGGSGGSGGSTSKGGSGGSGGATSKGGSTSTGDAGESDGKAPACADSATDSGGCSVAANRERSGSAATLLFALTLGLWGRRRRISARA
jgi:hypothetical protein